MPSPYVETRNNSAQLEHETTTSKIDDEQLFYCCQRGISKDDIILMIFNDSCKEVFSKLPLKLAAEAQELLVINLEYSMG